MDPELIFGAAGQSAGTGGTFICSGLATVLPRRKFRNFNFAIFAPLSSYYQIPACFSSFAFFFFFFSFPGVPGHRPGRDADTFGRRPGLLFRTLAYFTRSLITINIRLPVRSFAAAVYRSRSRSRSRNGRCPIQHD